MSNATLSHHVTRRVDEAIVLAEPEPDFTASWHPFSHRVVVESVGRAVAEAGFKVTRKEYSITSGAQMFGIWEVVNGKKNDEFNFAIGLRNSINKSMAVGLCAGERVFVCDNMVFSSEFVLFRKHTGMLDESEIFLMAREALGAVIPQWDGLLKWHEGLKSIDLTIKQASILTVAAMRRDLIPPSKFCDWNNLFYGTDDDKTKYSPTLHGWHGATTELMNDLPIMNVSKKQTRLNAFIDHEVPLLLSEAADKKFYTFDKVEEPADEAIAKAREQKKKSASELRAEFRDKVVEARREAKAKAKADKAEEKAKAKAEKAEAKAKAKAEQKPAGSRGPERTEKQKAIDEKMRSPRRTARVKVREQIAAEAEPVKTKVGKAPKGEKVTTIRRAAGRLRANEADDVYFCADCGGEFAPSAVREDKGDKVCVDCFGKRLAKTPAGKLLKALKKK